MKLGDIEDFDIEFGINRLGFFKVRHFARMYRSSHTMCRSKLPRPLKLSGKKRR
jgi:hypothetical protein